MRERLDESQRHLQEVYGQSMETVKYFSRETGCMLGFDAECNVLPLPRLNIQLDDAALLSHGIGSCVIICQCESSHSSPARSHSSMRSSQFAEDSPIRQNNWDPRETTQGLAPIIQSSLAFSLMSGSFAVCQLGYLTTGKTATYGSGGKSKMAQLDQKCWAHVLLVLRFFLRSAAAEIRQPAQQSL